jgi:hypothetical protein
MEDRDAIIATVMDYFEGWFDGDVARMERSLHPELAKRGVREDGGAQLIDSMTAAQMIGWTREGGGTIGRPSDLVLQVNVDDIYEQIATVSVRSAVYVEYLQLARTVAGWRIVNALYVRRQA